MKINGGSTGPVRPNTARDARGSAAGKAEEGASASSSRIDSVELSSAGRAKAAEVSGAETERAARLLEIRQRVLRGAYDTDEVVAEVARRILDRGDLEPASATENS
jgi:anti-sigma28 factor (negative regulator of flagellin synthesis)